MLQLVGDIVEKEPSHITDWFDHLKENNIKPDSIRGRLHNISILFQQFSEAQFRTSIPSALISVKNLIKVCQFEMKTQSVSKDLFAEGLIPRRGKKDLLGMWTALCPVLDQIILVARQQEITHSCYVLVIRILLFGFYSENANGRMQAIVQMTIADFKHLSRRKYFTSSVTKSVAYHGKQLVCLGSNTMLLGKLREYMDIVRPQALNRSGTNDDSSLVFLQ